MANVRRCGEPAAIRTSRPPRQEAFCRQIVAGAESWLTPMLSPSGQLWLMDRSGVGARCGGGPDHVGGAHAQPTHRCRLARTCHGQRRRSAV